MGADDHEIRVTLGSKARNFHIRLARGELWGGFHLPALAQARYLLRHLRLGVLQELLLEVGASATEGLCYRPYGLSRCHMHKIKRGVVLGREHRGAGDCACGAMRE